MTSHSTLCLPARKNINLYRPSDHACLLLQEITPKTLTRPTVEMRARYKEVKKVHTCIKQKVVYPNTSYTHASNGTEH